MDKYTVDLDQVLNDFEYSELTDQQSKNASEKPQSTTAFQPPPVTKHSINNVFHSLNEYLNSEISSHIDKVELREDSVGYDQQNVVKSDNNLIYNVTESYKNVKAPSNNEETGLDVTNNQFNSTFESFGQNERLLKLKNEPHMVEKNEDNLVHVNNGVVLENTQPDQIETHQEVKDLDLLTKKLQPILLKLADESIGGINIENLSNPQNDSEKSKEGLCKTDNQNFSLLDTDIVESELIPGLSSIENNVKSEVENVYNDKECDKNIDNKADNNLNNEQSVEKQSFFDVTECETGENGNNVNIFNINENKEISEEISLEKTEGSSNENGSYDNVNISKIIENFVIEPSESPYALARASVQNEKDSENNEIIKTTDVVKDVKEYDESIAKFEIALTENNELHETSPRKEDQPTSNDSKIKEDSPTTGTTCPVAETDPTTDDENLKKLEQKIVVGFSTELDIDENELNKMLEDLEIEDDTVNPEQDDLKKSANCFVENQACNVQEVDEDNVEATSLEIDEGNDEIRSDIAEINKEGNEPSALISEEKTDCPKDISLEKPTNNEDSTTDLKKSEDNVDNQLIECLEIEKPSKSKTKSVKSKEKHSHMKEYLHETSHDAKEDVSVAETEDKQPIEQEQDKSKKPTIQKQQSHDSLTRPQDLPLRSEDENVTRRINLIGSPGSTPYNNVYINKSIEPKTTQDTDSDYTSSASPTFSDCSTDSTSTASTASVEDFPKNAEGAAKNPSHKHRHSERAGVKNRAARQGEQGEAGSGAEQGERNVQEDSVSSSEQIPDTEGATGLSLSAEQDVSVVSQADGEDSHERSAPTTETFLDKSWLGKEAPLWIPDADAATCLHCDMKFTVLKRRHHCRACGLVLCSKCCNLKFRLEYLDAEARVCTKCYDILNKDSNIPPESGHNTSDSGDSPAFRPNPNNPLEYCSTVSPLQQIGTGGAQPPSVMVPVGVLKRKGSNKKSNKSVMFCDGIAPGSDLTHLDQDFNYQDTRTPKSPPNVPEEEKEEMEEPPPVAPTVKSSRNQPKVDQDTGCFIPKSETSLPPTVCTNKTDILYSDCSNSPSVVEMLKNEALTFAINQNLFVQVRVINMSCCINKQAWCFSTDGLINVGSDEIVYLIEYIDEESFVPKDVFFHMNNVYLDAVKGTSVKELGLSLHNTSNFLDSKNHAGFVYIRPTFQCLENVLKPKEPYLIGILIHRWETPWAKLFPLRLILRLGAEYRYYPSPLISTRHRDSVFVEIGHTIINLLADFRNFTYTLPQIRGLIIHMEDKKTTITIPRNRYDQVMKSINNSSEHILAFAGNFSAEADSHLVCIQDTQGHENSYTTHAINIHNKPRKITGASFIVFNGSLKSTSGLTAKSNIVEDGLMIQIPSEHMDKVREHLRTMKDHTIACGCINATSDESVNIVWGENDVDFNAGVQSPVDLVDMIGIPSIRVHNGKDYFCNNGSRLIRWTEVFILQNGEENPKNQDPVDISKVSESIAKACCTALVKYLDLLVSNSCQKIGIRVTLHVENVSYSAGSNGLKLPPIYMKSLDNELIPVLHRITSNNLGDNAVELELIFRILNA